MAQNKPKAEFAPPASQVDLAERLESGNASDRVISTSPEYFRRMEEADDPDEGRVMQVEGNDVSGFVGVDPIYANYANETEKPGVAEGDDNPEAALEEANFGQLPQHSWEIDEETQAKLDEARGQAEEARDRQPDSSASKPTPVATPNSADNPS